MKWTLLPLALLLSACDSSPPPQPKAAADQTAVFQSQVDAMKKARAVERQVMDGAEAQRKQIDEATQR